jgi:acetyl esterase/lipase
MMSDPTHTGRLTACRTFAGLLAPGLIALGLAVAAPTAAQAQMPPDVAAQIAVIGRVVDPPATGKVYLPLQEKEPYNFVKIKRDVKYGAHARNVLDIFVDDSDFKGRPVLMFVHGGGFVRGAKSAPGSPYNDNVMVFAARNGMVGVNVEYRLALQFAWPSGNQDLGAAVYLVADHAAEYGLAPEFPWPAGNEDLAAAVRYVADHIAEFGGDPNRVYLMGQSAGAVHVATYLAHTEFHGPKGSGLAGAIFASGIYDLTRMDEDIGARTAYYGDNAGLYTERSALPGLLKTTTPFMIVAAELNPPMFNQQFDLLKEAMCKSEHGCVRSVMLAKHNHVSEISAINTADTSLTSHILEFVRTGK